MVNGNFSEFDGYNGLKKETSSTMIDSIRFRRNHRLSGKKKNNFSSNIKNGSSLDKNISFSKSKIGQQKKLSMPNFNRINDVNIFDELEQDKDNIYNFEDVIRVRKNNLGKSNKRKLNNDKNYKHSGLKSNTLEYSIDNRIGNIKNKYLLNKKKQSTIAIDNQIDQINNNVPNVKVRLIDKKRDMKKQEIMDKINILAKSDRSMKLKENSLIRQGNKVLNKQYNSLHKLIDENFDVFNETDIGKENGDQYKQPSNLQWQDTTVEKKQEYQQQFQQQPSTSIDTTECLFSPLLDDASAIDSGLFNSIYPKYNRDKYIKLKEFSSNQDLVNLINDRPDIESLDVSNCNLIYDFSPILKLKHLKEFAAHNCQLLDNIDFLSKAEELEVLNVSATSIVNISNVLPHLKKLKVLNLAVTRVNSLDGLENCKDLIELIIWGCLGISDLSPVENIYNLRVVDIDFANIRDLFPLVNSKKLEILYADNCDGIKDLSAFEALTRLKFLSFSGSSILPLNQLNYFSSLENIQVLDLSSRKISTASVFGNLKNLIKLNLNGCAFADCSPLSNLEKLQQIDMTGNSQLRDISSLSTLKKLKKLIIGGGGTSKMKNKTAGVSTSSNMYIEDISVIADMPSLEELDINSNPKVRSLTGIKNCPNMEEIVMNKCIQMEEISELRFLQKLTKIEMNFCPKIKDLYFIQYLPNLMFLLFDGTIVDSAKFLSNFKKSLGIKALVGYGNDMLSQNVIKSAKKRLKSYKLMRKIIKLEED